MLRFVADENFNNNIVRGLLRRQPELDIVRVQDVGLTSADDPMVLKWASQEGRVLLSHDVATITQYAYERVAAGLSMPGVFEMSLDVPISRVIEDILLLAECSLDGDGSGKYVTFPCKTIPFIPLQSNLPLSAVSPSLSYQRLFENLGRSECS